MRLTWLAGCAALTLTGCAEPIYSEGPGQERYAQRPYPAGPPYGGPYGGPPPAEPGYGYPRPEPRYGAAPPVYGGAPPEEIEPGAPEDDPYGEDPGYPGQPYRSRKG
jgi:hypothetical protein